MKKILIIEDQVSLKDEINDLFSFEGYLAFSASNGIEGLEMARKHIPDLILCDIMLPGLNGHEILQELRKDESTQLIPFIFMTALSEREDFRAGMELGADDYISKPFTWDELHKSVKSRLAKSKQHQDLANEALDELRTSIITSLPHELRTPLNGILGFAQLLKSDPDIFNNMELKEVGENIYISANRLYRLIQNYLLYAQLELRKPGGEGKYRLKNPEKYCESIARDFAMRYNRINDLELQIEGGEITLAEVDFSKVMEEILDNAFKFSASGQKVEVSCRPEGNVYIVVIKDHGIGLKPDEIIKIGAYMQFNRRINEQQGSGLGLIISIRIVELYEGKMQITSEIGKGTSIHMSFPIAL
jgi:two-component system sensor histidine kinase/response regulator